MELLEHLPSYSLSIHRLLNLPERTEQERKILLDLIERERISRLIREQQHSEDSSLATAGRLSSDMRGTQVAQ
jgi:hypothetical protein